MDITPRYQFEPPPQLYISVDYHRDPLFFRIPSPRFPLTNSSGVNSREGENIKANLTNNNNNRNNIRSERVSSHRVENSPKGEFHLIKKKTNSSRQKKQEIYSDNDSNESPKIVQLGVSRRDFLVHNRESKNVMSSPRIKNTKPQHYLSSSTSLGMRDKKENVVQTLLKESYTSSSPEINREITPRPRNNNLILSPRLTKSAILRREFNSQEILTTDNIESPRGTINRLSWTSQYATVNNNHMKTLHTKGSGNFQQGTTINNITPLYSPRRIKVDDNLSSPRGTKSAALRIAYTKQKLDINNMLSESTELTRQFVRTGQETKIPLSNKDKNQNQRVEIIKKINKFPPVPEFKEINLRNKEDIIVKEKNEVVKEWIFGQDSNIGVELIIQTNQEISNKEEIKEEIQLCNSLLEEKKISHTIEEVNLSLTDLDIEVTPRELDEEVKIKYDDTIVNKNNNMCAFKENIEFSKEINLPKQLDLIKEENNNLLTCKDMEVTLDQDIEGTRESTVPPDDIVEQLYTFSSDAFSDETNVTPRSISEEKVEELTTPPSYWRDETLPMLETKAESLTPSELSAEDDMPIPVNPEKIKNQNGTIRRSPDPIFQNSNISLLSKRELREKLASIPRYLILEYAETKKVKPKQKGISSILPKYKALQQNVRMSLLRKFFHNWFSYITHFSKIKNVLIKQDWVSSVNGITPSNSLDTKVKSFNIPNQDNLLKELIAKSQLEITEVKKDLLREKSATPIQNTIPLKEKSPPPLSQRVLEDAFKYQQVLSNMKEYEVIKNNQQSTLTSESSCFSSSLSNICDKNIELESVKPLTFNKSQDVLLDTSRPTTPVNFFVPEVDSMQNHSGIASLNSSRELSFEDLQRTTELEKLMPFTEQKSDHLYRIKYLHSDL